MYIVSGKTFEIRELLKSKGGKWNESSRVWEFQKLSIADRVDITEHMGVSVTERVNEQSPKSWRVPVPPREPIEQDDVDTGKTTKFGDDHTWFNYFDQKNPISFFGFSGMEALAKYVEAIPFSITKERLDDRNSAWDTHNGDWAGTSSMSDALQMAREGWSEGVAIAEGIVEQFSARNAIERRRKHSVAGGSVSVGRMLARNPMHMNKRYKSPGKRIITFFSEAIMSSSISARNAATRAAVIAAVVDLLEHHGYQCEIISVMSADRYGLPVYQFTTTLKDAGEALNINDVIFGLGHPSFLRRLGFATCATDENLRDIWSSMGTPTPSFKPHQLKENEYYIGAIQHERRHQVDAQVDLQRALQIWNLCCDKRLPVELKG